MTLGQRELRFVVFGTLVLLSSCARDGDNPVSAGMDDARGRASQPPESVIDRAGQWRGEPAANRGNSPREFFPLAFGNRWRLHRSFRFQVISLPDSTPEPPFLAEFDVDRAIIGRERLFGREYIVEETRFQSEQGTDPDFNWVRYRQDHAGLYAADVSIRRPPTLLDAVAGGPAERLARGMRFLSPAPGDIVARAGLAKRPAFRAAFETLANRIELLGSVLDLAPGMGLFATGRPGGQLSDEILRLDYPLHRGAEWTIREQPFFGSIVEGLEVLDLPAGRMPAYRVRIFGFALGPEDYALLWFGHCGRVRLRVHIELVAVDFETGESVLLVSDEEELLESVSLNEPGRCSGGAN